MERGSVPAKGGVLAKAQRQSIVNPFRRFMTSSPEGLGVTLVGEFMGRI